MENNETTSNQSAARRKFSYSRYIIAAVCIALLLFIVLAALIFTQKSKSDSESDKVILEFVADKLIEYPDKLTEKEVDFSKY